MRLKFNPLPHVIAGKRLVVVDDSIVRGSTTRKIVQMLRDAGAREVHLRISAPPIVSPCFYGIDMAKHDELIAAGRSIEEIRAQLGADSLAYLSLEGLQLAIERPAERFCRACLTGDYPVPVPEAAGRTSCASSASPRGHERSRRAADLRAGRRLAAGRRRRRRAPARAPSPRRARRACSATSAASPASSRPAAIAIPVLVAGTDGVGTKLLLQREAGRLRDSGIDLVAMCVNDVLTCGAEPVLFLDYIAVGRLDPERVADVVEGVADGCRAGGLRAARRRDRGAARHVRRRRLRPRGLRARHRRARRASSTARASCAGDAVIGLAASGVHSNGFTLVRRLLERAGLAPADAPGDLLAPTRIYARAAARAARGLRGARDGAHHRRRHPGQPAARAAGGPRRAGRRAALAGARRSSTGSPGWASSATRCAASSTAASATWPSCPPGDVAAALAACAAPAARRGGRRGRAGRGRRVPRSA